MVVCRLPPIPMMDEELTAHKINNRQITDGLLVEVTTQEGVDEAQVYRKFTETDLLY